MLIYAWAAGPASRDDISGLGTFLTMAESQLALAALASLCTVERDAVELLRRLLRRARPTFAPAD